jgi:uncharacterized membrane protein
MSDQAPASSPAAVRKAVVPLFTVTLAGALAWLSAIFVAPYLMRRAPGAANFVYGLFSPVCHQIPARCLTFQGYPLAVCGRCLGIYAGFLAGLLLYPFARGFSRIALPSGRLFLALSIPIGLDFAGGLTGIVASPIGVRFATGILWGSILPFYFMAGVSEFLLRRGSLKGLSSSSPGTKSPALDNSGEKNVE